jgi:acetylornithine/succinyldiaminopimelate/putrescine aminotransferase
LSRIGRPFAYQYFGVEPDLLALGKGLGGGLPIAAVLAREPAASALEPGTHGSTFGGNPMSCAAALAVCRRVLNDRFAARVERVGEHLREQLQQRLGDHPRVRKITGIGLMIGVELDRPGQPYVEACQARGLLINCTADRVLRLLPPLIVTEKHCREAAETLAAVLDETGQ